VAVAIDVVGPRIDIIEGAGGPKARIAGSRIRVQDVVFWYETQGMSVNEIVENYPTFGHADVFAALAYYWDHRDEIEAEIARDVATDEEFRQKYPGRLAEKLETLRSA
jgi:uncharacterized protein (DUF433 family)